MSIKSIWRPTVFVLTIVFIYLAFPILIVPSSLPAIKAILVEEEYSEETTLPKPTETDLTADAQIYEINIETEKTLQQKFEEIKKIHQQGMDLILARN